LSSPHATSLLYNAISKTPVNSMHFGAEHANYYVEILSQLPSKCVNPFNDSCSKLLLFERFSTILTILV